MSFTRCHSLTTDIDKPFVIALALLALFTGGLSLPSLCHGVLVCNSFFCPIALSICPLNPYSCSSNPFWFSSFARSAPEIPRKARAAEENVLEAGENWCCTFETYGLLRKVESICRCGAVKPDVKAGGKSTQIVALISAVGNTGNMKS
jgi:hypothetical protein